MSLASRLFYQKDSESETLHRRIAPTDEQIEFQKERWNELALFLISTLRQWSGYEVRTWLQGSYKFLTQTRPARHGQEFDIDLGVYFVWEGESENGPSPASLKKLVQDALILYAADVVGESTEVSVPKERCCRIRFDSDFHIDVPSYHLDPAQDARKLATETLSWEDSDPKAIYECFKNSFKEDDRRIVRRVIQYLKMWAALKFASDERPTSLLITVLAAQAYSQLKDGGAFDDDDLLGLISLVIADRLDVDSGVPNPANESENLNRMSPGDLRAFTVQLRALAALSEKARMCGDLAEAAEIWSQVFEHLFPLPEDTEEGRRLLGSGGALVPFSFKPNVIVKAVSRTNRHVAAIEGYNEIRPVPKDCDITFSIASPEELPHGARIQWTVRNHGLEAEEQNDLGHLAGSGLYVTRNTRYNGDHSMDLTIFLGDKPIGRRRIVVRIQGAAIPPRNPARKRFGR
jgi:hypothetical protein